MHDNKAGAPLVVSPGMGRRYACGPMTAIFKADEEETNCSYSVSEWWLEPHSEGPGPHLHEENEEVFYVLEGQTTFLIGEEWVTAGPGTFIRIPPKTMHDFVNRSGQRTGVLNFFIPGGFERNMPAIVQWFKDHP